jgi:hypothetical protein
MARSVARRLFDRRTLLKGTGGRQYEGAGQAKAAGHARRETVKNHCLNL